MDDLISRRAAIDAYGDWYVEEGTEEGFIGTVKQLLEGLPSVQPATSCSEIPNSSDDTISRKAAIEALARMMPRSYTPDGSHPADEEIFRAQEVFADCIEALEILPAAQPEKIRCKDCRFNDGTAYCLFHFRDVRGEGYCSWAERRTDG